MIALTNSRFAATILGRQCRDHNQIAYLRHLICSLRSSTINSAANTHPSPTTIAPQLAINLLNHVLRGKPMSPCMIALLAAMANALLTCPQRVEVCSVSPSSKKYLLRFC
jgi:hypothetical protein